MLVRKAHWIFPLAFPCLRVFQVLQNGKQKQGNKQKPSTLVLSSFIADNFIRCQEKQKMQTQNNNLTVIFGVRKWKTQQAAGEGSLNIGIWEQQP